SYVLLWGVKRNSGLSPEQHLLVNSAERLEEIDIKRAEEAKERAQERLRQKQSIQEYHLSQASLARAMTRLKTSKEKHWNI
ncbi:MAG: F0F1 ATP synthase subunit epsilon, partial [[Clostridium] scindens]